MKTCCPCLFYCGADKWQGIIPKAVIGSHDFSKTLFIARYQKRPEGYKPPAITPLLRSSLSGGHRLTEDGCMCLSFTKHSSNHDSIRDYSELLYVLLKMSFVLLDFRCFEAQNAQLPFSGESG